MAVREGIDTPPASVQLELKVLMRHHLLPGGVPSVDVKPVRIPVLPEMPPVVLGPEGSVLLVLNSLPCPKVVDIQVLVTAVAVCRRQVELVLD